MNHLSSVFTLGVSSAGPNPDQLRAVGRRKCVFSLKLTPKLNELNSQVSLQEVSGCFSFLSR